jgi:hypothetical protein
MRRVLLVGGSRHGQWMEVDRRAWNVKVPKPAPIPSFASEDYTTIDYLDYTEIYNIERVPIQFEGLRCVVEAGIWSDLYGIERSKAVVAAIFQRDIAEQFKESGWDAWV